MLDLHQQQRRFVVRRLSTAQSTREIPLQQVRHVISVNERGVEQTRVLRLHAHRQQGHETLAERDGEQSGGSDHVINVIFADVHDVLALVDALLHGLHELLHRLLLLSEVLSTSNADFKRT